jgi:hypothetical protein
VVSVTPWLLYLRGKSPRYQFDRRLGGPQSRFYNEYLYNLYSSADIIRIMRPRRIQWERHAVRIGRSRMHIKFYFQNRKRRYNMEGLGANGRTT